MLTKAREHTPWLREGSSVVQQQIIRDFGKSRAKAQKDIRERLPQRQRAGMPRWKKKREALPTLNYTKRSFRLNDELLHLAGGIVVSVVWSRDLPAEPSSVRVYQDSAATTTSDAHDLPHAQHGTEAQTKLARYDRMMARRKPSKGQTASKGYREAKEWRTKTYQKIARQRQDHARKWAKKVVRDHDVIAVEDFKPKFLAKTSMGRKHARDVRLVHPAHTTMDCSRCGARAKHALPRSERTYTCTACGFVSSRDKNSARVMLVRAGLNPAGDEGVRPSEAPLPKAA
jgi:putative transposase